MKRAGGAKRFVLSGSEGVLVVALLLVTVLMSRLSPVFLSPGNFFEVTRYVAEVGLISLGMTAVIITAGIDLSVGSIVGLVAISIGTFFNLGVNVWLAALLGVLLGAACGAINGLIIAWARIPPIIVTLATLALYSGLALGFSQGHAYQMPRSFYILGQGYLGPVPVQALILGVAAVIFAVVMSRTVFGRSLYAIGHNEIAARFSGIRVSWTIFLVYVLSGLMSGLAAVILVSRVSSARADLGSSYMLDSIAAVVLGGTAISGGRGGVWGTILGLFVIGFIRNGMNLAFIPSETQSIFVGLVLILAVALDVKLQQQRRR